MRAQIALVAVVLLLTLAFTMLNWTALNTTAPINLLVTQVQGPLGVVIVGFGVVLIALFVLLLLWLQTRVLLDGRRHTRELAAQRELADKAEASRFTELRNFLETQENAHMARNAERHAALLARIEQLEASARSRAEQTDNSIAAHIGQLEDRFDRRSAVPSAVGMPPAV